MRALSPPPPPSFLVGFNNYIFANLSLRERSHAKPRAQITSNTKQHQPNVTENVDGLISRALYSSLSRVGRFTSLIRKRFPPNDNYYNRLSVAR